MTIGERIREIRKANGLSQEEFGKIFHVTRQAVSNWETGKNYPDMELIVAISKRFGVSLDDFIKEDETFIRKTDEVRREVSKLRKVMRFLAVIVALLIVVGGASVAMLISASRPTDDANRVLTDADIYAYVDLKGSVHSRAITRTYRAGEYDGFSDGKKASIIDETKGGVEGDIPAVVLDRETAATIVLQDMYHNDIPDVTVKKVTVEIYNLDLDKKASGEIGYTVDHGKCVIDLTDLSGKIHGDQCAVCTFELKYAVGNEEYVTVTSINIFAHEPDTR